MHRCPFIQESFAATMNRQVAVAKTVAPSSSCGRSLNVADSLTFRPSIPTISTVMHTQLLAGSGAL